MSVNQQSSPGRPGDRRRNVNWALEPHAIALLDTLPPDMRLLGLRRHFPHVLNQIALDWDRPENMQRTIQPLLIDMRGNRQGFPRDVRQEIADLADYYFTAISGK